MKYQVDHNEIKNRFEAIINNEVSIVNYTQNDNGSLTITTTRVPKEQKGQGIAAALTKAILEYAKKQALKVQPLCPYTKAYIDKHPEYQHLVMA